MIEMKYYECYIKDVNKLLTYSSQEAEIGTWVEVTLRGKKERALVIREVDRPTFTALPILKKIDLPKSNLIPLIEWMIKYYYLDESKAYSLISPKGAIREKSNLKFSDDIPEDILEFISKRKRITLPILTREFGVEHIQSLIESGDILEESTFEVIESSLESSETIAKTELSKEQNEAVDRIENEENSFFLIRGVTGSGKTSIYIKLIEIAISKGEGVILLLPEIALASDIARRIGEKIKNVSVIHSASKNFDKEWLSISKGEKKIVIGVRSAVFAPVQNLRYIIVDEEHENTYKQDKKPIYDARAVAMKRAELEHAKLIMGSATPSLERYYYAKRGKISLISLDKRYMEYKMPEIELLDMRKSKDIIHPTLEQAITTAIANKRQVLVVINRKGYSTSLRCSSCGETDECRDCSVSLTYYKSENVVRCNYCNLSRKYSEYCSKCKSYTKKPIGRGTELIEEILSKRLGARVVRFDGIVNRKRGAGKEIFEAFVNKEYDILVGTKLIAKGLDFPNISLVAILDADTTLHFPDFRAAEKSYQLITQSAGRAGRYGEESKVYVQTYNPDHYVMRYRDYIDFYDNEIKFREELRYPPFSRAINIVIRHAKEERAIDISEKAYRILKAEGIKSYPPVKSHIYRAQKIYRYNIFLKLPKNKSLGNVIKKIKSLNRDIKIDVDPLNI